MFETIDYATHPEMMEGASNEDLRRRHLVSNLFRRDEIVLNYSHGERFIIGDESFELAKYEVLYVTMGSADVRFAVDGGGVAR